MFYAVSALRISSLFIFIFLFYFWVIRCSVGATYTVAFLFAVLCQFFTFSVICYFDYVVSILFFHDGVGYVIFFTSQIGLCCLYFL